MARVKDKLIEFQLQESWNKPQEPSKPFKTLLEDFNLKSNGNLLPNPKERPERLWRYL